MGWTQDLNRFTVQVKGDTAMEYTITNREVFRVVGCPADGDWTLEDAHARVHGSGGS